MALLIATLEGIRVTDNAKVPVKVAEYVHGAGSGTDVAAMLADPNGATTLLHLFAAATLPIPNTGLQCDNSLIPPWSWTSSFDPNLMVYVPLGGIKPITALKDRSNCLNAPKIPPAAATDPVFLDASTEHPQPVQTAPITTLTQLPGRTADVRVTGNWFVVHGVGELPPPRRSPCG